MSLPHEDDITDCCWRCDGEGVILICPDDLCQGQGICIHGDGEIECPVCGGAGDA